MLRNRASLALQSLLFVGLVGSISVVGSERMFWYWSTSLGDHAFLIAFYAFGVFATLWAMARYRLADWRAAMLALPMYAYMTEGFITPVMYSGGPFVPFFPVWFTAWHGMLAFGVLVLAIRHLLLHGSSWKLFALSAATGTFWGFWSSTLRLPENAEDEELIADSGPLEVLDPDAFSWYAITFTAVLIVSHYLLGYVWPRRWQPSRVTSRLVLALTLAVVAAWSIVVPWALPMFVAYAWLQIWAMRRIDNTQPADTVDLIERLHGRVPARRLLPVAVMAPAAALTYLLTWQIDSELTLRVIMYGTIVVQTLIAAVAMVWSLLAVRGRTGQRVSPSTPTSSSTSAPSL